MLGRDVPNTDIFVIGDTPLDIEAAHAVECTAIAVATGKYDRDGLREAGADHVLDTLEEELPLSANARPASGRHPYTWSAEASDLVVHAHRLFQLLRAVIRVFATLGEHRLGQPVKPGLDRVLRATLRVLQQCHQQQGDRGHGIRKHMVHGVARNQRI